VDFVGLLVAQVYSHLFIYLGGYLLGFQLITSFVTLVGSSFVP
jgi:hypothetical protein